MLTSVTAAQQPAHLAEFDTVGRLAAACRHAHAKTLQRTAAGGSGPGRNPGGRPGQDQGRRQLLHPRRYGAPGHRRSGRGDNHCRPGRRCARLRPQRGRRQSSCKRRGYLCQRSGLRDLVANPDRDVRYQGRSIRGDGWHNAFEGLRRNRPACLEFAHERHEVCRQDCGQHGRNRSGKRGSLQGQRPRTPMQSPIPGRRCQEVSS